MPIWLECRQGETEPTEGDSNAAGFMTERRIKLTQFEICSEVKLQP